MKCVVVETIKLAGMEHPPGSIFEVRGEDQRQFFGDKIAVITDPDLIRTLEAKGHPYVVLTRFTYGRKDYLPDDLFWATVRSQLRALPEGSVRPATGDEVVAWVTGKRGLARTPTKPEAETKAKPRLRTQRGAA